MDDSRNRDTDTENRVDTSSRDVLNVMSRIKYFIYIFTSVLNTLALIYNLLHRVLAYG